MTLIKTIWPLIFIIPLFSGILGGVNPKDSLKISSIGIGLGLLLTVGLLFLLDEPLLLQWQWAGDVSFGFRLDTINAFLVFLVYLITLFVQIFSITYMEHDPGRPRYTAKLGFFAFSMIGLLLSDQMITVFFFWELVGLSSYLLIGFWYQQTARSDAARQAFMINRVADAFLLIGIVRVYIFDYGQSFSEILSYSGSWDGFTGLCFVIAAFGKSAQFPFYGWLTKAMAGPTPVSALIHAATMVTAGVYLLFRIEPVLIDWNLHVIAVGGAVTAFMAAIAAIYQFDIKKVLAYSTISQLGYMITGIGVGTPEASIFHLWTHAFFKAGLFLAAGAVIHYMHELKPKEDPQNMRNMGGLKNVLPFTFYSFLICGLALSGLPLLSGFLSKEGILTGSVLWSVETGNYLVPILAFVTAGLTAFYIGRQVLLVFFSQNTFSRVIIEPIMTVRVPLIALAAGTLWFWNALNPIDASGWYWNDYLFPEQSSPLTDHAMPGVVAGSIALAIVGLGISYGLFKPGSSASQEFYKTRGPSHLFGALSFHGWYLEKFYDQINWVFVRVVYLSGWLDQKVIDRIVEGLGIFGVVIAKLAGWFDQYIIDGMVNLTASLSRLAGNLFTGFQSSKIQIQIAWLLLTLLVILLWFLF